jgi:protein required for attachment to host cells
MILKRRVEGWILVANGRECRIYTRNHMTGKLDIVKTFGNEESRLHNREMGVDKPGRVFDSVGTMRHAMEPKIFFTRQARQDFARKIAEFLEEAAQNDRFHALSVAASASFLGELRGYFSDAVQEKIVIQVNKDLTNVPPQDLLSHLYQKAG